MIQLITMLKRKPGTTHDEFLQHWLGVHGPLLRRLSCAQYIRRYEQHPTVWPPAGSKQPDPAYDGVTIQWFDSAESFFDHLKEPDQGEMFEDIARFLDTDQLHWTICEEPTVVIGEGAPPIGG